MIKVSLAWVANAVEGQLDSDNAADIEVSAISTDTRTIDAGSLFIALVGPNFNGNKFIDKAEDSGAIAAIVSEDVASNIPTILVEDTKLALGKLGAAVKAHVAPKTVGITGSAGKTTVKEMVASILATRGNVLATKGNFNNDIGVPLTLLELTEEHEYAVVEMGANHLGEIDYTCGLTKPDVSTIVNANAAHLEGFGSLFGVARAKSEIFNGLSQHGLAVLNKDSQFYDYWLGKIKDKRIATFSAEAGADYYPSDVLLDLDGRPQFKIHTPEGSTLVYLPLPGQHNVTNALLAAALAIEVGATIENIKMGLEQMSQVAGRLNIKRLSNQIRLLDDTYNASIGSVNAAVDLLATYSGKKIVILGDMGELGEKARYYHEKVGEYAKQNNIDAFYSLGVLSQNASAVFDQQGKHFSNIEDLMACLESDLINEQCDISILVKGSRSAKMERVVKALEESPVGKFERSRERIAC